MRRFDWIAGVNCNLNDICEILARNGSGLLKARCRSGSGILSIGGKISVPKSRDHGQQPRQERPPNEFWILVELLGLDHALEHRIRLDDCSNTSDLRGINHRRTEVRSRSE